jgi:hypothetical protein
MEQSIKNDQIPDTVIKTTTIEKRGRQFIVETHATYKQVINQDTWQYEWQLHEYKLFLPVYHHLSNYSFVRPYGAENE